VHADEPFYFEMPPPYYPSRATITPISEGDKAASGTLQIESEEYWEYIQSGPAADEVFKTIQASTTTGGQQATVNPNDQTPQESSPPASQPSSGGGGCLIATAAFGSELSPQIQFLRSFRDNHILSTATGSSFMTAFNAWYYSFSPQVAEYERQQPWLQQTVKIIIYPLLGILQLSEKAFVMIPGEYGSIMAGFVASSLIGAVYISPIAISIKKIRQSTLDRRFVPMSIAGLTASVLVALFAGNSAVLMVTTSLLVLATMASVAFYCSKVLYLVFKSFRDKIGSQPAR
jgi:peptide/nickel transport system substrate-binding protein